MQINFIENGYPVYQNHTSLDTPISLSLAQKAMNPAPQRFYSLKITEKSIKSALER